MTHRILIVEDFAPMRAAILAILGGECELVGYADHGSQVMAKALQSVPQVILLDISIPGISGLELLPGLRQRLPEATIVILTNRADKCYRREAFARGADSYVLKGDAVAELLPAIRRGHCAPATNAEDQPSSSPG